MNLASLLWSLILFFLKRMSLPQCLDRICSKLKVSYEQLGEVQSTEGGLLVISNHRSILDPLIVMNHLGQINRLEGQGVSKAKLYSRILWYFIHKNHKKIRISYIGDSGVFRRWIKCIRAGLTVMFFPEGTRNRTSEALLEFMPGADKLIQASKANVLMYYIQGSEKALRAGRLEKPVKFKIFRFEEIDIDVESLYRKSFNL